MTDLIDIAEKETPVGAQQSVALQDERTVVVNADATSLMAVISRAASDPNTDVDKLERLMAMYERITDRTAKAEYSAALAELQPKLPVIDRRGTIVVPPKDGKTGHTTPYARWEDINDAIREPLAQHGFALSFRVAKSDDRVVVTGILSHRAGHAEETTLSLPMDTTGSKNNVQAIGSSVSYGKRYTACALLNITTRGEDDDGKAAGDPGTLTEEQASEVQALMEDVGADRARFLSYMQVDSIADIPAKRFKDALAALEAKRKAAR